MKMSANTILMDFSVDLAVLAEKGFDYIEKDVVTTLEDQLKSEPLEHLTRKEISAGGHLSVFAGPRGSVITLRSYPNGLVTINIDYYLDDGCSPLLTLDECRGLEGAWGSRNKRKNVKTIPHILRGIPFETYFLSSDERLLEYDIDKIIYDERSPYQHIQIVHSANFGNLLVLDDLQNLAESDLIYTESIMCRGVVDYTDKEVLILGGGDGALLYELRKENAKKITMIEIDEMVMEACKIHLRSACGDTLDFKFTSSQKSYQKDNYEIIVGDCIDYMLNYAQENKKFDFVFADLTDIPISKTPQSGEIWEFVKQILNLSFRILKDDGMYMTHCNGMSSPKAMEMFEQVLSELEVKTKFTKNFSFVPSFMENWAFYFLTRDSSLTPLPPSNLHFHTFGS